MKMVKQSYACCSVVGLQVRDQKATIDPSSVQNLLDSRTGRTPIEIAKACLGVYVKYVKGL